VCDGGRERTGNLGGDKIRRIEVRRRLQHKVALVPRRVVAHIRAQKLIDVCELGGPQVERLEHPLPVTPGMVVLRIIVEHRRDEVELAGRIPKRGNARATVEPHLVVLYVVHALL
jgi:hypothetical protein